MLFFLRAFTGLSLALGHGAAKIVSGAEYEAMLAEWGVPGPGVWAWISAVAETLGGFFLAAGLFTRIASLFASGNMAFLLMVQYGASCSVGVRSRLSI